MAEQKVVTTTNKAIIWIAGISMLVNVILFMSGMKFNPYWLLAGICVAGVVIFYFYKKPKQLDFYAVIESIKKRHSEKYGYYLDDTDVQAIPIDSEISFFYFPKEELTFSFNFKTQKVQGMQISHLFEALKRQEKSKLSEDLRRFSSARAKQEEIADSLGIDKERLGLD